MKEDKNTLLSPISVLTALSCTIDAAIPKFEYEYSTELSKIFKSMGMENAFDRNLADFSGIGVSDKGNLAINRILHKTYIALDEKGTKAAAATAVEMVAECAMIEEAPP